MSTPTQPDLPEIELTPEYVGGLLRVLRTLKNPPPLPDRKDDLWQNTVDRAKAELQEEARERAEQRIGRPRARGKRTTAQEKHKLGQQFDRAVQARARRIYRNLDPIRAEAEQKIKDTFDEKLAEFARLCARVRNALTQRSKLKERDLWVYGPLPVFDYGEYWWLAQNDWQRNWQKRLPKTIHDLELIRQVLVHRAGVSEAEAGAKSEAEARVGGSVNGSDEVAKKSHEERPSSGAKPAEPTEPAERANGGTVPGLWTQEHCPSCGRLGITFITQTDFAERAAIDRKTVGRRVKQNKYWHDRSTRIPWCERCKEKTPEGRGVERPVDAEPADTYSPSEAEMLTATEWASNLVPRLHLRKGIPLPKPDPDLGQGNTFA